MTAVKDEEYYQAYLEKLDEQENVDQIENDEVVPIEKTGHRSVNSDCENGSIIMDADGYYYYESTEKIVKIKKVTSTASSKNNKNTAKTGSDCDQESKLTVITRGRVTQKGNNDTKITNETITSEIGSQEEVYEFDENEQDPDDPGDGTELEQDYKCKGFIKNEKKTRAKESSYTCTMCTYQTSKKCLFTRHLKTHSDERPYKCCVCERGFKSNTALSNHRNIHLGLKPHGCSSCDMAFTTSGELVRHVRYRHTHIKPHKCSECDYSSVELSKLRRHMRCHTGERPYQCPHCTYASPDTFKLKRHMRIHTGEKPYECDICHARFTQSNSMKHHRLIHSVNEKPVFQCHLCPTTCGRKTDLRLHIKKLHSSDQPIGCKRCGKELLDRYSYKMHIKTHEGEKCYRCEYCPYASISKRHLESHVFIHLDAKPFVCEFCQSRFRQKPLLTRHIKIYHSDNYEPPEPRKKDHKCPHCNKMFAFNGNLIRHMEIHDPTSRLIEEKEKLKMGRLKRVATDGSVVTVSASNNFSKFFDGSEEKFCKETEEEHQIDGEEIQEEYEEAEEYTEDTIQYVYDDYEAEEYEEQYEDDEEVNEPVGNNLLIDVKQEKMQAVDIAQTPLEKIITVKTENNNETEIMSLEVQDGQQYMFIEVLPDDDEEEQQKEQQHVLKIKPAIINKKETSKNSQKLLTDCFGFKVNSEEEDEDTKEAIKLFEMIEEE